MYGLLLCVMANASLARTNGTTGQLIEYLAEEKINLALAVHERPLWTPPHDHQTIRAEANQIEMLVPLVQAKIAIFERYMISQRARQHDLSNQLKRIQQSPLGHSDEQAVQDRVSHMRSLLDTNNKAIELIKDNLVLAHQYQATLLKQSRILERWEVEEQTRETLKTARETISLLDQQRAALYKKILQ